MCKYENSQCRLTAFLYFHNSIFSQFHNFTLARFHDRFLIIDNKELYLIGASLKDLGSKCFAFTKLDAAQIRRIKAAAFLPN